MAELRYRPGGLMRCCIESLRLAYEGGALPEFNFALHNCAYCNAPMRRKGGAWEWSPEIPRARRG